jgi:hypothetical protein
MADNDVIQSDPVVAPQTALKVEPDRFLFPPPAAASTRASHRARPRSSVNVFALGGGILAVVALTRLASYLTPYKLYFSFSSFLYSDRSLFRGEALAIKLMIPVVTGFLLFYLPFQWMVATRGSRVSYVALYRYLSRDSELSARTVGFLSALLLAWPFIVFWDVLMQPNMQDLRLAFVFVYFLYFVSYSYFAGLGVSLARLALRRRLPDKVSQNAAGKLAWVDAVRTSFLGLVTSGIATYLAATLGSAH